MKKHKSHPKLLQVTKPIIDLSKEVSFTTGIVSIEFHRIKELEKQLLVTFTLFSKHSNYPAHYTLFYTIETNLTNTLMTLLFLLKYKCPDLYRKKHLIMEFIYNPFLQEKFKYDHCKKEEPTKIKGGVYALTQAMIKDKECLISGGWVFAVYQRKDLTYRNIIDNVYDECILSLCLYGDNQLLTGYKSGKLKLWTIESFHIVKFINCFYNKFASSILSIYYTDIIIFFENNKITIWKELENEIYSYQCEEGMLIQCSEVYYDKELLITNIYFGEQNGQLKVIRINKDNLNEVTIVIIPNEMDKGVYSLKYYQESSLLFIGINKGVQLWKVNNATQMEMKQFFYLNREISYMTYLVHNDIMYLFCGGKESLFIIHLK